VIATSSELNEMLHRGIEICVQTDELKQRD
jgi:hypothetical protein